MYQDIDIVILRRMIRFNIFLHFLLKFFHMILVYIIIIFLRTGY